MDVIVIFFGLVLAASGMIMLLQPRLVMDTMCSFADEKWLQVVTVATRFVLGSVLLVCAEQTRFPLALQIIGLSALTIGIGIALIPALTFRYWVTALLHYLQPYARLGSLALMALGVFLIYAMF